MADYPDCTDLLLSEDAGVLHITFNRPQARNAISRAMGQELLAVLDAVADDRSVRAVVFRGAEGNFCAGGDIKDMAKARQATAEAAPGEDPVRDLNREFGAVLRRANALPQATIAMIEGAVLGGGFGLCCVSDVAIAHADATFGLPETGLGIPPAQIAPFVVERIGITQARRLGVCGGRFKAPQALRLGIVHEVCDDTNAMDELLATTLKQVRRCAPGANAVTKQLMLNVGGQVTDELLDKAAASFADCVRGDEGVEGTMAFIQKRLPSWASP